MEASSEHQGQVILEQKAPLAVIRLGTADEKTAILTEARLKSFAEALAKVASDKTLEGLVIIGPSHSGFCAGADINAIKNVQDASVGESLARQGQEIFQLLADLSCTTVAAISGACVGGGCEMVLACDYRILLDSPETKIGLPEVKLGILPGFGGTQRLPRLIGLPSALDIILSGKVISAGQALRRGLADRLVGIKDEADREASFQALESTAADVALGKLSIKRQGVSFRDRLLTSTGIGRSVVRKQAKAGVMKETHGHYPAPLRAVDVTVDGLAKGIKKGLADEAKALGELIVTPESKSLVHLYFLTETAGKLGRPAANIIDTMSIGVIGGGVMGAGIAATFLARGYPVVVVEPIEEARGRASAHIKNSLGKRRSLSDQERDECLERLRISEHLEDLAGTDFIVEAIVEDLEVKKSVFAQLEGLVGPETVLATNTSSLSVNQLAEGTQRGRNVLGMHFFNPAEKMPLVEVVRAEQTGERATFSAAALAVKLGKHPVIVEDVPGFLVNRILSPYISEAARLLGEGVPIEQIDAAAKEFGMPMGPIRLLDEVGLDVAAKVQEVMTAAFGKRMSGPDYLQRMVKEGRLGRKSKRGFYRYEQKEEIVDPDVYRLLDIKRAEPSPTKTFISERLAFQLINEAVRCLDEKVAGMPGKEAAGQIDLATVMGIGFAPFRGGVLHYAQSLGPVAVRDRLNALAEHHGERFKPCEGIVRRAAAGSSFYDPQ